jgi:hypothetical protein
MENMNFKVEPSNYLGHDFQCYCNEVYALALSHPEKYFEMRKNVLNKLKKDEMIKVYDLFYDLLVDGTITTGVGINATTSNVVNDFKPSYPKQKVAQIALSASSTLENILNEVIEIILPIDFKNIALRRLSDRGGSGLA